MFPKTRMVWLGPTRFFFHRDLSGEVALTDDDEPVLCRACSDDQVQAGVMQRLGEAPESEQCRCCGRFSWGRVESVAEFRPSLALVDASLLRHLQLAVAVEPGTMLEVVRDLEDETSQRLADLGTPPVDPTDAAQTHRRLDVLRCFKAIAAHLASQASGYGEGLPLLAELAGIVRQVAQGYGDMDASDAPYADILRRADAYLGAAARLAGAQP